MSRRSALPGAAELFRSTGDPRTGSEAPTPVPAAPAPAAERGIGAGRRGDDRQEPAPGKAERLLSGSSQDRPDDPRTGGAAQESPARVAKAVRRRPAAAGRAAPTGRERHDEKITVYVSVEELMDLERARLTLRGEHGVAVDRGRIVREALAMVLADLEAEGEASTLVQRLRDR